MKNSKQKGNNWEREVSTIFSQHFHEEFRRVPQSGAIFGGLNRKRAIGVRTDAQEILSGDIIAPEGFKFSLECKSYKQLEFHGIYCGSCKKLDDWIKQSQDDATFCNKDFLLLIKINRKGTFACLKRGIIDEENMENYMIYKKQYVIMTLECFLALYV